MRIASGVTDQYVYFLATLAGEPVAGLSSFTVYWSRNGGAATQDASVTVNETSAANMPGVYEYLVTEGTTIDAGDDEQEYVLYITATGMDPVVKTLSIYRPKITAGNTLGVASDGDISGNVDGNVIGYAGNLLAISGSATAANNLEVVFDTDFATNYSTVDNAWVTNGTSFIGTGWNVNKTGYSISGTITTLDALDTAQDTQHGTTQSAITALNDLDAAGVATAVWNAATITYGGAGTYGQAVEDTLADTNELQTNQGNWLTATGFATATEVAKIPKSDSTVSWNATALADINAQCDLALSDYGANTTTPPTAAAIADQVWNELQSEHVTAGSFGVIASEIADILVDTAVIGAAGAGLSAIPWNAAWDAEVQSECTDALNAYDPPTRAELTSDIAGLNDPTAAAIADAVWDEVLTSGTHNVGNSAGRRLRNIQDFGIYDMASVWVDEVAGTSTGTVDGEDATVTNRANDLDNALTVAASVGVNSVRITNGNSITLTAPLAGFEVYGNGSTLALGNQSIAGSILRQFASVTGVAVAGASQPFLEDCIFGAVTLPPCTLQRVSLSGTLTVGSAGDFQFRDCCSAVAGSGAPVIDLGAAVGATTISLRRWSGGLTLNNVQVGDVVSVDVVSGGTITINGTGGTVVVRGLCAVVDGSAGSVSITQSAVVNMTKINTEATSALTTYDPPTRAELTSDIGGLDTKLDTAQADLDIITGADGVNLLSATQASIDAIETDTDTTIPALIAALPTDADVLTQVNAALDTAISELGVAAPTATPTVRTGLMLLYMALRNKRATDATSDEIYNDAGTLICSATLSDDTLEFIKGEYA